MGKSKDELLFYREYEKFYSMAAKSKAFRDYCQDAFGADFSQDGFSDLEQIDRIRSYLPKREDLHILDVGCGNGKMLGYLQRETQSYIYGFDYSEVAIQTAISRHMDRSEFRVGVMGEIEYPREMFDVVISMDSIYFAKDMTEFVLQVKGWLKSNGVFLVGYQEGDVMPKTENSETTEIAQSLKKNGMHYKVLDITEDTYYMLRKKRESILKHRQEFEDEGLKDWFDVVLGQTDCITVSLEEYSRENARYIYIATKE